MLVFINKYATENEKRLADIRKEMAGLGPVPFGDMSAKTQKRRTAGGSFPLQKAPSLFRFAEAAGNH